MPEHPTTTKHTIANVNEIKKSLLQPVLSSLIGPPANAKFIQTVADTGSTGHFFKTDDVPTQHQAFSPSYNPIDIELPDGNTIRSTAHTHLDLPCIPRTATLVHLFPDLHTHSLLSIGQLCEQGCHATFDANAVTVTHNGITILQGTRETNTGLWNMPVPIEPQQYHSAHTAFTNHQAHQVNRPTKAPELVAFAHAALFSPSLTTLHKAIRLNFLHDFPGLTNSNLRQHPPITVATIQGHLDQSRKNQRPTERPTEPLPLLPDPVTIEREQNNDAFPAPIHSNRTHHVYTATFSPLSTGQIYTDQTGRMSTPSSSGATQLFVLYDYDSNSIHAVPMATKSGADIVQAFTIVYNQLVYAGLRPQLQRLDNECSQELQQFMQDHNITPQLVPPGVHRSNAAERAIRTFKNHFIAGLSTTDPSFPIHLWDRLLPQALITLNLLRASRINPALSAYAQVFGQYSYSANPLAPPGTHVMVHVKPDQRESWAPHALNGWYLGPALGHHRCYRVWIWSTKRERITDTVTWLPIKTSLPQYSPVETITACTYDITEAIKLLQKNPPSAPLVLTDNLTAALKQFHEVLTTLPTIPALPANDPQIPAPEQRVIARPEDTIPDNPNSPPPHPEKRVVNDPPAPIVEPPHPTYLAQPHQLPQVPEPRRSQRTQTPSARFIESILSAINVDTGLLTEYKQLLTSSQGPQWVRGACEEWARLAQGLPTEGIPTSDGTNTIKFITIEQLPPNTKPTYPRIVVADRPQKANPVRVRVTVGGNLIDYPDEVSTKTSDLATVKIILNSTISTPNAKFMTLDIKDFYLNTPMERPEYMKVPLSLFPQAIIDYYHLTTISHNNFVYVQIDKGMYGLPQAGRLANNELVLHLQQHGYIQSEHTNGLFIHNTRPISFCLVVDDFGVKYVGKEHAEHLVSVLKQKYVITTDWEGSKYVGLTLTWNHHYNYVDISMPTYIQKALARFEHPNPARPQHSPHAWNKPVYGAHQQMAPDPDNGIPLTKAQTTRLQQIIGVLLYYARAVDSTMLVALGTLASAQTHATNNTMNAANQLLDYAATHPDATVRFHRTDMILTIHSDASYLSETEARSRAGGIAFLSNDSPNPLLNGAVHIHSSIMDNVLSSAAEAEVAALFHNAQDACPIRNTLIEIGHEQPATPMQTDNKCAHGILNDTVKQKRTKAMDMRYYWLRDRVRQDQFRVHWEPGIHNLADYFTKHHPPAHHKEIRASYLTDDLVYLPQVTARVC